MVGIRSGVQRINKALNTYARTPKPQLPNPSASYFAVASAVNPKGSGRPTYRLPSPFDQGPRASFRLVSEILNQDPLTGIESFGLRGCKV